MWLQGIFSAHVASSDVRPIHVLRLHRGAQGGFIIGLTTTRMNILLACHECGYQEWGREGRPLMNKIIMWNHVRRAHPRTAEQIMRRFETLPDNLYRIRGLEPRTLQW